MLSFTNLLLSLSFSQSLASCYPGILDLEQEMAMEHHNIHIFGRFLIQQFPCTSYFLLPNHTSFNKFWFTKVIAIHCLNHFLQTDINGWILHCKEMWWKFWWSNIFNYYSTATFIYAVYWSNDTPSQPVLIEIWNASFTAYDLCWIQHLLTLSTNEGTVLNIIFLYNLIWYWFQLLPFLDISWGCNFFFANRYILSYI